MLVLNLELPVIGFAESIIEQNDIPCHVWIGQGKFLVKFSEPVFDATGTVTKWERRKLEAAAPR